MPKKAKKAVKSSNPVGPPTKYRDEIPQELLAYFSKPLYEVIQKEVATNSGVQVVNDLRPSEFPSIEGFCGKLLISKQTFHNWTKEHPQLMDAYKVCKDLQKRHLVEHGLQGNYNSSFAKFVAINCTDMVEKKEIEHTVNEIKIDETDKAL